MERYDRLSSLFFIALALLISEESVRLGPGSLSNPGPGLIPLGCGFLLGLLGLIAFGRTFFAKSAERRKGLWEPGTRWGKVVSTLISLTGYTFLINLLGFHITTFLWLIFIFRGVEKMGWKATLFSSIVTTFSSYLLFEYYLNLRFPKGWGF